MIINTAHINQQPITIGQSPSMAQADGSNFAQILEQTKQATAQAVLTKSTQLQGDYLRPFEIPNPTEADRYAKPQGIAAAALQCKDIHHTAIDKTSQLYQHALELESYLVKIMLNSMRSTIGNSFFTGNDNFAGKMYEDMMYENLSRTVTQNAGLGLADQIYIQLNG
ncbi:MAG: rod-binding protein [Treponema sp.]